MQIDQSHGKHANLYTIVFLYKRAKNAPKRKISAQVIPDTRPHHGGLCIPEDMESIHADDGGTGHHTTSNLTLRH